MQFCLIFVKFLFSGVVKAFPRGFSKNSLQEAFVDIVDDLSERNKWLMLVAENFTSDVLYATTFATASVPHIFQKWNVKRSNYLMMTSTIALLNNVASVQDLTSA